MSKQDLETIVFEGDVQQFLETVLEITEGYEVVGDWDLSEFVNNVRENTGSFCDE